MIIPYSQYKRVCRIWNTDRIRRNQRLGQFFVDEMKLERSVQDKEWVDKLYEARESVAEQMMLAVLDYDN